MGKGPILDGTNGGPTNDAWVMPVHKFAADALNVSIDEVHKKINALDYHKIITGGAPGVLDREGLSDAPYSEADIEWLLTTNTGVSYDGGWGDIDGKTLSIFAFWAAGYYYDSSGNNHKGGSVTGTQTDGQGGQNATRAHVILEYAIDAKSEDGTNTPYYERIDPGPWAQKLTEWALAYTGLKASSPAHAGSGPFGKPKGTYVPVKYEGLPFIQKILEMTKADNLSNAFLYKREDQTIFQQSVPSTEAMLNQQSYSAFSKLVVDMLQGGGYPTIVQAAKHLEDTKQNLIKEDGKDFKYAASGKYYEINTLGDTDDDGLWFAEMLGFYSKEKSLLEYHAGKDEYSFQLNSQTKGFQEKALKTLWKGRTTAQAEAGWHWGDESESADDFTTADFSPVDWKEIRDEEWAWGDATEAAVLRNMPSSMEIHFNDNGGEEIKLGPVAGGNGKVVPNASAGPLSDGKGPKKLVINTLSGEFGKDTGNTGFFTSDDAPKGIWSIFKVMAREKGPEERLSTQWFLDNFSAGEAPYPASASEAGAALGVIDDKIKEAFKNSEKKIELGAVNIFKDSNAFSDKGNSHIFGENMFRRMYLAAYTNAVFYYQHYEKSGTKGQRLSLDQLMGFTAYRAALVMNQLWTQFVHDHAVGNMYGLIVAYYLLDPVVTEKMAELKDVLMNDAKETSEKSTANIAEAEAPEEDDGEGEKAEAQRERLYKQCALLLNMDKIYSNEHVGNLSNLAHNKGHIFHGGKNPPGYGSYNNRVICVQSQLNRAPGQKPAIQSNNLLNKLIAPKAADIDRFLNLKVPEAANLLPYVRLFKVWNDAGKQVQREFKFPLAPNQDRIAKLPNRSFDRGDGVGLKEFSWEYDGETPATATKYIKAKMTLLFQNFEDFTKERESDDNGPDPKTYRFVDLFVSPTNMNQRSHFYQAPHSLHYDPNYYRIKVEVGYSPAGLNDHCLERAVKHINRSFYLVLVDNDISINEDMTVSVTANYRAYIEEAMDSYKFNALTNPSIMRERKAMKAAWEKALGEDTANCSPEELGKVRELIDGKLNGLVKKAHQSIMMRLLAHDKIHYVDFNSEDIDPFRKSGIFPRIPSFKINDEIAKAPEKSDEKFKEWLKAQKGGKPISFQDPAAPSGNYRTHFFYLGDLVYILMSNLYSDPDGLTDPVASPSASALDGAENTRLCLLDFEYHVSLDKASPNKIMNIADIPISTDFFVQWYTDVVIKGDMVNIPVGNFIKRILVELISEALSESCVAKSPDHRVSFGLGSFLAGGIQKGEKIEDPYVDPLTYMMAVAGTPRLDADALFLKSEETKPGECPAVGDVSLPLTNFCRNVLNTSTRHPTENPIHGQFNYLFIYADYENPAHPGRGVREDDHANGTFHVNIGRDVGLVKKVNFSKTDVKYLRESRMANQGQAGLLQLSAVYNCSIDMIGNTLFLPGMEFWLDPYGFGGPNFGMPQDKPLAYMPSGGTVDSLNKRTDSLVRSDSATTQQIQAIDEEMKGLTQAPETIQINSYANVMGIGGYQLITKVSCKISPGEYSTTVEARHIYTGYPKAHNPSALYEAIKTKDINDPDAPTANQSKYCGKLTELISDTDSVPLTLEAVAAIPVDSAK